MSAKNNQSAPDGGPPPLADELRLVVEQDTLLVAPVGDYSLAQAQKVHAELERMLKQHAKIYLLVDQSRSGHIRPETRRFVSTWHRAHKLSGIALFGGSLLTRAAATLLISVVSRFQSDAVPTMFTKTEGEARKWLAAQRSHDSAGGTASSSP
jgi:hypothetical protein